LEAQSYATLEDFHDTQFYLFFFQRCGCLSFLRVGPNDRLVQILLFNTTRAILLSALHLLKANQQRGENKEEAQCGRTRWDLATTDNNMHATAAARCNRIWNSCGV
jgi:hypothetical protein